MNCYCYWTKQTWVHFPDAQQARYWHWDVVQESGHLLQGTMQGEHVANTKGPKLLLAYKQEFLKTNLWERIVGCVISSCQFFWWVSGEVTGLFQES